MGGASAVAGAMGATALGGVGLTAFLMTKARAAAGARPLAAFLVLVGFWAAGSLLPDRRGEALMAVAPLGAAAFVHFAARLAERGYSLIKRAYSVGTTAAVVASIGGSGRFVPWLGGGTLFRYDGWGLVAAGMTLVLAAAGHILLLRAYRASTGKRRRQIGVVVLSSTLGLASVSALALPLLDIQVFPWPLLLLPLYLVVLAYGVLRYELMAANQWARRALTWGVLVSLAVAVTALPAGMIAAEGAWPLSALAVAVAIGLSVPVRRLVDRVIFPGGEVTAAEISAWRAGLDAAQDEAEIDRLADDLLRAKLRVAASDWAEAPPGPRRVIDVMASLRGEARRALAHRRVFAERQRLAELGALGATVAHDLRNPMNIIAMAVADAEPDLRREVKTQLTRMEALVRDLLDYAKPWAVDVIEIDLAAAIADVGRGQEIAVEIPAGLSVRADPLRLGQALGNLLNNAQAAGARVRVVAERTAEAVLIHVCDDGPGIPDDIRAGLFQPFVSRGEGGTGLGLAIVAKVMAAHGGAVSLGRQPGWTTCFTLRFPP